MKKKKIEENNTVEIAEEVKEIKKENKILKIVLGIIIVALFFVGGWFVGVKLADFEEKVTGDNTEKKEDTTTDEDTNNETTTGAIDKDEAPNPAVVKVEKFEAQTTTTKPDYGIEVEDYEFYKDGSLGYYSDRYSFGNEDIQPDREVFEFIKLYECKNKEYGKCGIAEPLGVTGEYNLEEGLKTAAEGLVYLDQRYIFVYDSNLYQKFDYASYFSEEAPLIIYDTKLKKEVVKLAGVYADGYSSNANSLIGVNFEGKYGVFKIEDGKYVEVIPFNYDYVGHLYEAKQYMLVKDGQYYVYNPTNKKTYGPYNNQISQYSEKFIVTNEGSYLEENNPEKNYRLYTIDGKKILTDAGYEYIDIIGDYVIVIDSNKSLNVYDATGKAVMDKPIEKIIGTYHIRCCAARMAYEYKLNGNTLELLVLSNKNGSEEMLKYVIDLKNKTYKSEVYISEE